MIQFNEDEVCRMVRGLTYYRDHVTGNDYMWDKYNDLLVKLHSYGEEVSPGKLNCEDKDGQ